MPRPSLNGTDFGDWLVMPANDNHVTLLGSIEITGEVVLGLLNVDFDHVLRSSLAKDQTGIVA
jgi:hypothetical protein